MPHLLRSAAVAAALAIAALSLTACQPEWFGGRSGSGGSGGSSGSNNGETPTTDSGAGEGDSTPGSECPVGDWTLDNESWAGSLGEFFVAEGMTLTKAEVTGELHLTWQKGGDYVLDARASEYNFSGTTDGQPFAFRVSHNGTETGSWSESGAGEWTLVGQETGGVDTVVSLGESEAALVTVSQGSTPPDAWEGVMTITCTSTGMTTVATEDAGSISVDWVPRRR